MLSDSLEPSQILALFHLLEEQSVSRAAARMSISQSSMSHRLKRLRDELDDPLLVRRGRSLVRTPRAERIVAPLRSAMSSLRDALSPPEAFSPAATRGRFRIYLPDLLAPILPELCRQLNDDAPDLELEVQMVPNMLSEALSEPLPSLALAPASFASSDLKSRRIGQLHFGVVGRKDHPALVAKTTLRKWLAYGHVVVSIGNSQKNPVEQALEKRKLQRKTVVRVPSFLTGLITVASSDYLMNAPLSLARASAAALSLRVERAPIEIPSVPFSMLWHERNHNDPAHTWVRQKVFPLAQAVTGR